MEFNTFQEYLDKYGNLRVHFIRENCYIIVDEGDRDILYSSDPKSQIWHRLDGPAYIRFNKIDDIITNDWYVNDFFIDHKIEIWAEEHGIDLYNLTEVDKALIKITWANYGK